MPRLVTTRRSFLGALSVPAFGALAWSSLHPVLAADAAERLADLGPAGDDPAAIDPADESFWFEVQQAFTVDRSLINLNNGGVSPSPATVQEAMKRYLDFSNTAPTYAMWKILEPQREGVRQRLARTFGCSAEEIALTRNASEGLHICQMGFDLEPGDEVLTTSQDYPRMVDAWLQRERREGIKLRRLPLPVPMLNPYEVVARVNRHITKRTRLILICHVVNLTGQILPVRQIVRQGRQRGIPVIVDGAHAFAHLDFRQEELECEYYATSLHKWLCAPHGTGMLYVRKDRIPDIWPLMPAPESMAGDIRKFEEIGTHPAANYLAIGEALTLHLGIGAARKQARLLYLRDYWAERLGRLEQVRFQTNLEPGTAGGIATFQLEGVDSLELNELLWQRHRIITTAIKHEDFEGLRVTPNVYTTLEELDRFCEAIERIAREGIASG